jgi:hypothetical protein
LLAAFDCIERPNRTLARDTKESAEGAASCQVAQTVEIVRR